MNSLCVYCGAAGGNNTEYFAAARALGRLMGERGIRLIYGGGGIGMMGAVADGCLDVGGAVTGVITRQLVDRELAHPMVADMRVVETMHERKTLMVSLADAFVALPGGYGTFDELFECVCWAQLGLHHKPLGLLDTAGFFSGLIAFLRHAQREGFLRLPLERAMVFAATPEAVLDALASRG